jgi:acyl carrier protein
MARHDDVSRKLEAVLRPHLRFLKPDAPLPAAEPLGALGLDSMAAINLLLDLETSFGVQIPDDLLSAETFETFASLEATFRPLLVHAAAEPGADEG